MLPRSLITDSTPIQIVNAKSQLNYLTPLHLACQRGNQAAVTTLLKCDSIDINVRDNNKDTPLHQASLHGHTKIVAILLQDMKQKRMHVGSFNPKNNEFKTPLHFACQEGHVAVVTKLLFHDSNSIIQHIMETPDNENNTALHLACESGNVAIVTELVNRGANVQAEKLGKVSPIHIAARCGSKEIAVTLLDKGSNSMLKVIDIKHRTPLHYAAAAKNQVGIIGFLLDRYDLVCMREYNY